MTQIILMAMAAMRIVRSEIIMVAQLPLLTKIQTLTYVLLYVLILILATQQHMFVNHAITHVSHALILINVIHVLIQATDF